VAFHRLHPPAVHRRLRLRGAPQGRRPEWLAEDEQELSGFQTHLVRELPHRKELCGLVGDLWPEPKGIAFYLGGYSMNIGEMYTEHLYTVPEVTMAADNLEALAAAGKPGIPSRDGDFSLEEKAHRLMREWVPLAQFESDDVYIGRFLIPHDDLAAGRLKQAFPFTAFTE
jgi:hypothetical protein